MFSVDNEDSLMELKSEKIMDHLNYECEPGAYKILIGNKCDLDEDRTVLEEDAVKAAEFLGCDDYKEMSIKNVLILQIQIITGVKSRITQQGENDDDKHISSVTNGLWSNIKKTQTLRGKVRVFDI